MNAEPEYDTIKVPISALRTDLHVHWRGGPRVKNVQEECALLADRMAKATSIASELEHVVAAEVYERGVVARAYDPQLLQAIRMYAAIGRDQQYYADATTRAVDSDAVDRWLGMQTVIALKPETRLAIQNVFNPTVRPLTKGQVAILHMRDRLRQYSHGNVATFNAWTVQMSTSTETWICLQYGTYFERIDETYNANSEFIRDDSELAELYTNFRCISHTTIICALKDLYTSSLSVDKRDAILNNALKSMHSMTHILSETQRIMKLYNDYIPEPPLDKKTGKRVWTAYLKPPEIMPFLPNRSRTPKFIDIPHYVQYKLQTDDTGHEFSRDEKKKVR